MQAECLSCGIALQIMCPVTEADIQEHVRLRLEAEQKEKELKKKEKAEAHLYTVVKLVRDKDIKDQIGNGRWFDLANPDKVSAGPVIRNPAQHAS